ncbi:NAD(P)/FAD-dependent oxidoreductase [Chitinophaga sp. 212800010-3]|uniref:FAD-dependent oxidoreductase n=1 Tax=unclassified Chitinophaga TaxID=2619133 RepID=UPI002DF60D65|nr:Flavin-dependent monooxygenase [Chitinophaga sp. 212800010-3]
MILIKEKSIAIVGGGPGGLTLAKLLQQKGASVKVYERDLNADVRQQGATLDLHDDSGLKALQAAGLMEQFRQHYRPGADKVRVVDENAVLYRDDHTRGKEEHFGNSYFRPEIDRGPLRDILITSLQPGTIVWDSHFIAMEKEGNGWLLRFNNGTKAYADLVIAADGAHSKIRPLISDIPPVYSGLTVVEANIYNAAKNAPALYSLLKGGKVFAIGKEKSLILSSKGNGSLSFYTGCWEDENWVQQCGIDFNDRHQVFDWFKECFVDWDPLWHELFSTDEVYFIPRPMYHYPLDQHWNTLSNLTMLGDAAHRMPPYAGEGVNMAMLDALELSICLTSDQFPDLQAAIASFEKAMCLRASAITAMTLDQMEKLHSENGLPYLIHIFEQN